MERERGKKWEGGVDEKGGGGSRKEGWRGRWGM